MGFGENEIFGKRDFGKRGFLAKWDFEKMGFLDSGVLGNRILRMSNFGKQDFEKV